MFIAGAEIGALLPQLNFITDKLDAMHALVQARGMKPSDIREPDAENRYFYVYDPDGVSVQLKQQL